MANSDQNLIRAFVQNRDEAAFRTLTQRYLGLIFHVAYRQTNNRALSQDISQTVLLALSKKAPLLLKKSQDLAPWLHRVTLYESTKAMRSEQSHQRRKDGLAQKIESQGSSATTAWKDALPHLDEALNKLPEGDRRVLILHFFEEKPFPKVAQAIGKTPAATQKQSRRALEKLAQLLKRKGVVISSVAIASCLSSELAKAAPPSVVKALSTITLTTNSPLLGFGTLLNIKAPLILAIAAGASLATFLGARQIEIIQKKNHNQQLKTKLAQAPLKSTRPLRKVSSSVSNGRFQPDAALLAEAYYEADLANNQFETSALASYLQTLDEEILAKLLTQSASPLLPRKHQAGFISQLTSALTVKNQGLALRILFDAYHNDRSQDFRDYGIRDFTFWLMKSHESGEALSWLQEQEEAANNTRMDEKSLNHFRAEVLTHFIQFKSETPLNYLQRFGEASQVEILTFVYKNYSRGHQESDSDQFLQLSHHLSEDHRRQFLRALLQRRDIMPSLLWADELYRNPHLREEDRDYLVMQTSEKELHRHSIPNRQIVDLQHWLDQKDPSLSAKRLGESFASLPINKAHQRAISFSKTTSHNNWLAFYLCHEQVLPLLEDRTKRKEVLSLVEMIPDPKLRQQTRKYLSLED